MKRGKIQCGLRRLAGALAVAAELCTLLPAQTHKVSKPENVVRAVAVYEWTGDMAKPTASRLIPVSLFINGKLEAAAVYLADPVPFSLETGNAYELQKTGVTVGMFDVAFARHLVASSASTTTYDDGWFGYGKFAPPSAPKKSTLKPAKTIAKINALDEDDSQPHFSSRSATPGTGGSANPTPGSTSSAGAPADDPDRPTLHRSSASSDSAGVPPDPSDPDRPTLRRHTAPPDANGSQQSVSSIANTLNDDPNRPLLHRGKSENALSDPEMPKLTGLPGDEDLHQMVAVSDAATHPTHDFSRPWDDEEEHQAILTKMQAAAREVLKGYEAANAVAPATPPPPAPKPTAGRTRRAAAPPPPPPPEPLLDEKLMGYLLSYGGAPTYVYSAHTDGLGSAQRFVTLVAQVNMQSEPEIALKNVTDAAHLDRTPRMRLVDVVDAEASNRASLLFELRAQNSRQFALYRVIGARAEQTFATGSTQ